MTKPPRSIGELAKELLKEALVLRQNERWRPHTVDETWVIYVAEETRSLWIAHLPSGTKLEVTFNRTGHIDPANYHLTRNDRPLRADDGEWDRRLLAKAREVQDELTAR